MRNRHFYLCRVQFLGFRYSGWQKQPGQKTIEGMLIKTLKYILPQRSLKILGAGRTDAKVSALNAAFTLILDGEPIGELNDFLQELNINLPPDIRVLDISTSSKDFNIIQDSKQKEYHYFFSITKKNHPFCAPFMANFMSPLDIDKMKKCSAAFQGTHSFHNYTANKTSKKSYIRTVHTCSLEINTQLKANFFPETSYVLKIKSKGFGRYQVRMIMGALLLVGEGKLSLTDIEQSLIQGNELKISRVAPGSGLLLKDLSFDP